LRGEPVNATWDFSNSLKFLGRLYACISNFSAVCGNWGMGIFQPPLTTRFYPQFFAG